MPTNHREGAALFSRAVKETLDTLVAPLVRDALIHDALALGGLAALPTSSAAMRAFALGPLRVVTERALGVELALSVADEILRAVRSGAVRSRQGPAHNGGRAPAPRAQRSAPPPPLAPRTLVGPGTDPSRLSPSPAPPRLSPPPVSAPAGRAGITTPPLGMVNARSWPAGPDSRSRARTRDAGDARDSAVTPVSSRASMAVRRIPLVLVVTEDPALFETLAEWFSDRASISQVGDPMELVRKLDAASDRRAIVIIDGKAPSIRPGAIAILLETMPSVEVVLCRAAAATEQVVLSASSSTERWTVYREPASLDHVAAECVRLVS